MIDGHGDDTFRYDGKIKYNFSTNICCGVPHEGLMRHLAKEMHSAISSYPEPAPRKLEAELAEWTGVEPGAVMATSGAVDAIYLIGEMMSGARSAIIEPTFSEYASAAGRFHHVIDQLTDLDEITAAHEVVWLCNPNNPTGRVIPHGELLSKIDANPTTLFVVDQAYGLYTRKQIIAPCEAVERDNLLLLNSLTKRFSVPGLRVGYIISNPALISRLSKLRMPWAVSAPAIEGARYLVKHSDDYKIEAERLHIEALRLSDELRRIGIEVEPTDCNFILCRLPHRTASELKEHLATRHGILIRDASNFHSLSDAHFRVAVQGEAEDNLLISALHQWITQL